MKWWWWCVGPLVAAVMFAPPASADPAGDYLNGLSTGGIQYDNPGTAMTFGNDVCDSFRGGLTDAKVASMLIATSGLDWDQAHTVIANATSYLCPDAPVV